MLTELIFEHVQLDPVFVEKLVVMHILMKMD